MDNPQRERDQYKNDRERGASLTTEQYRQRERERQRERDVPAFFLTVCRLFLLKFVSHAFARTFHSMSIFEIERASIFSVFAIWFCI